MLGPPKKFTLRGRWIECTRCGSWTGERGIIEANDARRLDAVGAPFHAVVHARFDVIEDLLRLLRGHACRRVFRTAYVA